MRNSRGPWSSTGGKTESGATTGKDEDANKETKADADEAAEDATTDKEDAGADGDVGIVEARDTEAAEDATEEAEEGADANSAKDGSVDAGEMEMEVETQSNKLICAAGLATRIHRVIIKNIVPKLHQSLIRKVGLLYAFSSSPLM